ncbi:MAG: heme utilization protein HutZ [Gammaproteobacteria bacterium]|nr:heme utilization protein HutZ [Gammaproteobacteria bacterium]
MTNQQQCQAFFASRKSLVLSTYNQAGLIETSAAPFVTDSEGYLYLFISELAQHTQNILGMLSETTTPPFSVSKHNGLVSCLLISDERETEQMFARERLSLQAIPRLVAKKEANYSIVLSLFEQQFGEVVQMLTSLPDFHLVQLTPESGGYVKGFGQAFRFEGCVCHALTPRRR